MNYRKFSLRLRKVHHWLRRYMQNELTDYDDMLNYAYYKSAASKLGISYQQFGDVLEFSYSGTRRRILNCAVDLDSVATTVVAGDKLLCLGMLKDNDLPVPEFCEVPYLNFEEAFDKASLFSDRIVIKPARGTANARGVSVGVKKDDERAIKTAFWKAAIHSKTVLMEEYVEGESYRFLVCKKKLLSVAVRAKPFVVGDGQSSLDGLVKQENSRRLSKISLLPEVNHPMLFPIVPDYDVPKSHGIKQQDIVPKGKQVICRDVVDMGVGSSAYDVTEKVHPELAAVAIKTADITGVNLGGVDIICTDITKSVEESGAKVNEINTTPGLRAHYEILNQDDSRDVALSILKEMFEM